MKAAIYSRVSTREQAKDGYSLEAQRNHLNEWARLNGYEVIGQYVDDGYTGREDSRPELQRLMIDAEDGKFDVVLVLKLDRFMRSVKLLHQYLEQLTKHEVAFIPLDYPGLDTSTSVGKLMLSVLGAMAQFESDRQGDRIKDVRRELKEQHRWPAGRALYGYNWNLEKKLFEVVEDEATMVRRIFDLYVDKNIGQINIAEMLNKDGLRTRPRNHKNGHRGIWQPRAISTTLRDRRYTGKDETYQYPRIISDFQYETAKRKRESATKILRKPGEHLLQGYVRCGECTHKISPRTWSKSSRRVYECYGGRKSVHLDGSDRCTMKPINAEWLEEEIDDALTSALNNPDTLMKHIKQRLDGIEEELKYLEQAVEPIKKELNRVKERMTRLGDRYEIGEISKGDYEKKFAEYKQQLKTLEEQLGPVDPALQHQYRSKQESFELVKSLLEGEDWFDRKRTKIWSSFELFSTGQFRKFMELYQIMVFIYHDRVEIKGLIPTQVVRQINSSVCRSESG